MKIPIVWKITVFSELLIPPRKHLMTGSHQQQRVATTKAVLIAHVPIVCGKYVKDLKKLFQRRERCKLLFIKKSNKPFKPTKNAI